MTRLRILAGSSITNLEPITDIVNAGKSYTIVSEHFEGKITVYAKNLIDPKGNQTTSEYFNRSDRDGITWSIQVQGRFLQPHSANDILFGNIFDKKLKLPFGSGLVLKFMQVIDPTLEQDLDHSQPWIVSPFIQTMPHLAHKRLPKPDGVSRSDIPPFPPPTSISDDTSELWTASTSSSSKNEMSFRSASDRKSYFKNAQHRQEVILGPQDLVTADFCYGFIAFSPTLGLSLPMGISFNLAKHWDKRPIRFICCERKKTGNGGSAVGKIFWCVTFEDGNA